ncbi:hypothetical protein [uncultured Deinococcus sp.]|uniref:hypothetical protein n=1 Tax=uncultured Deinococcus sp. TaxID=158789 RepID=UPI0025F3E3E8|nr:hypothetical protein [uncultured Deinococcus sp.]
MAALEDARAALDTRLLPMVPELSSMVGGKWFNKRLWASALTTEDILHLAGYVAAPVEAVTTIRAVCEEVMPPVQRALWSVLVPALTRCSKRVQADVLRVLDAPLRLARCVCKCRHLERFEEVLFAFARNDQLGREDDIESRDPRVVPDPIEDLHLEASSRDLDEEIENAGPLVASLEGFVVGRVVARRELPYPEAVRVTRLYLEVLQDATRDAGGNLKLPYGGATTIGRELHLTAGAQRGLTGVVLDAVEQWCDDLRRTGRQPDFG